MPYVMIPAFPPSHQPLPVTPDSQLALPIQPIPCKPGECGLGAQPQAEAVLRPRKEPGTRSRSLLPCGLSGPCFWICPVEEGTLFSELHWENEKQRHLKTVKYSFQM